jgi:hypothetical protein
MEHDSTRMIGMNWAIALLATYGIFALFCFGCILQTTQFSQSCERTDARKHCVTSLTVYRWFRKKHIIIDTVEDKQK